MTIVIKSIKKNVLSLCFFSGLIFIACNNQNSKIEKQAMSCPYNKSEPCLPDHSCCIVKDVNEMRDSTLKDEGSEEHKNEINE